MLKEKTVTNLLIVDDDTSIRRMLSIFLRPLGHTLFEAANSKNALDILSTESIDIVITDVNMPGMTGVDLLKQIHTINPDMPVIIITGDATLENTIESLNAGAFAYIVKPIRNEQVVSAVNRAIQKVDELHMQRDVIRRYYELQDYYSNLPTATSDQPRALEGEFLKDLIDSLLHELGNATAALRMNLWVLQEQGGPPRQVKKQLGDLETSANTIVSILDRLKEYPQRGLRLEEIDLQQTLLLTVDIACQRFANQGIEFRLHITDEPLMIYGAPFELGRAFIHVVENAVEAIQQSRPKERGEIQIAAVREGSIVNITFTDNGPGFQNNMLEKLFSPGFTTKMTSGFVRGLGLGLFIVRTIVELHGGHIWLKNNTSGGACVQIQLPLAPESV